MLTPGYHSPCLSIITIVKNNAIGLERTIESILAQDYAQIQFIIIDGGSTDGTFEVIKKHEDLIDYWSSSPDKGLYDAMNKGASVATGEWLNFMNSGDEFINSGSCTAFITCLNEKPSSSVYYGDSVAVDYSRQIERKSQNKKIFNIWRGMVFNHQASFIKKQLFDMFPFDLRFKIVADYYQMLILFEKGESFQYIPVVISRVEIGGVAYSNIRSTIEMLKAVHLVRPYSIKLINFIPKMFMDIVRMVIGRKLTSLVRTIKWRFT